MFHTAGVIDDGLVGLKSKAEAAAVLSPKVRGTLVLDKALENEQLDFFVLFSSTSALLGLEGQVDYTGANAFLDAYARTKYASDGTPTYAINWGAWQQVGMAARLAGTEVLPGRDETSPFDRYRTAQGTSEYTATLSPQRDWLLAEHRTSAGVALLPGTSYLAFAHAAFSAQASTFKPAELRDVYFLQPFVAPDHADKDLRVRLEPTFDPQTLDSQTYEVTIRSGTAAQEREHVRGRLTPLSAEQETYPINEVMSRCQRQVDFSGTAHHEQMTFGERWKNVRTVNFGEAEALISLTLPEPFTGDLDAHPLHPALLDMATGKAQALIPGFDAKRDFYVPISYARVQVFAPLQQNLYSHVRLNPSSGDQHEAVSFDITLTDSTCKTLVTVERFTMKRAEPNVFDTLAEVHEVASSVEVEKEDIRPTEGMQALGRILAGPRRPQVIVSPQDFRTLMQGRVSDPAKTEPSATPALTAQARPTLATAYAPPQSDTEKAVTAIWQDTLGLAQVGLHDNFFELGGHSLLLTQTVSRIRNKLKVRLPLSEVFDFPTVAHWAELLEDGEHVPQAQAEQGLVTGPVPLTPGLHRFLERNSPDPQQWNIAIMLEAKQPLDPDVLAQTVRHILAHHDALRIRLEQNERGWQVLNSALGDDLPLTSFDFSHLSAEEQRSTTEREAANVQASFNLAEGPLFRVAHFRTGAEQPDRLLIVVHHFVTDALSWTILLKDFQTVYKQLSRGSVPKLPEKTTSYKSWAEELWARAQSEGLRGSVDTWLSLPWSAVKPLPTDRPRQEGANTNASARQLVAALSVPETEVLLGSLSGSYRVEDVMLAALGRSLSRWSGSGAVLVDVMGHGREETGGMDLSRSVGFFISYTPVLLQPQLDAPFPETLDTAAGRITEMGRLGVEHDLLRFLCEDPDVQQKMSSLPKAEVLFNYLGHRNESNESVLDSGTFRLAPELAGPTHSPRGTRYHTLAVKGGILAGKLSYTFVFSHNLHTEATLQTLAKAVLEELRTLIPTLAN